MRYIFHLPQELQINMGIKTYSLDIAIDNKQLAKDQFEISIKQHVKNISDVEYDEIDTNEFNVTFR